MPFTIEEIQETEKKFKSFITSPENISCHVSYNEDNFDIVLHCEIPFGECQTVIKNLTEIPRFYYLNAETNPETKQPVLDFQFLFKFKF
jgi:hypothetical protein